MNIKDQSGWMDNYRTTFFSNNNYIIKIVGKLRKKDFKNIYKTLHRNKNNLILHYIQNSTAAF